MTNVEKLNELGILGDVRQNMGANNENDTSFDEQINTLNNKQLISRYCAWHLGDGSWWLDFISLYEDLNDL